VLPVWFTASGLANLSSGGPAPQKPWRVPSRAVTLNAMSPISRGFLGRRQSVEDPSRVPPGQYVTGDFPVLSAGPTPHTALEEWSFAIGGQVEEPVSWTWEEFLALPSETRPSTFTA
jgi:DMSO/TMAO reductase YedYZ molybdopterin-dependent catalytic subunit